MLAAAIASTAALGCAHSNPDANVRREVANIPPPVIPKQVLNRLNSALFEVIVPKRLDQSVVYERDLPYDKLPYQFRKDKFFSVGTAFAIASNRFVSAAHVFPLAIKSQVMRDYSIRDTRGQVFRISRILQFSMRRDLIVFEVTKPPKHGVIPIAKQLEVGDEVITAGNALGQGIAYRGGQVASFTPEPQDGDWNEIRFSAPASPGNSGGPLLTKKGEVAGIVVKRVYDDQYGFAVPIAELKNLSKDSAEFFQPKITMQAGGNRKEKDWKFETDLPATPEAIAVAAQKSFAEFFEELVAEAADPDSNLVFPTHPNARKYLLQQKIPNIYGQIRFDEGMNWTLSNARFTKVADENGLTLDLPVLERETETEKGSGVPRPLYVVVVEKSKDQSVADLLANPSQTMTSIGKAAGIGITMAGETIHIKKFKAPDKTSTWEDDFGRPWQSSLWFIPSEDSFISMDCTTNPKGLYCSVAKNAFATLSAGYERIRGLKLTQLVANYYGSLDDWSEFVKLDKRYVPTFLRNASIRYAKEEMVEFTLAQFHGRLLHSEISGSSELGLKLGYSYFRPGLFRKRAFGLLPIVSVIAPRAGKKETYAATIALIDKPQTDESKRFFEDLSAGKSPYNGKAYPMGEQYLVRAGISKSQVRSIASIGHKLSNSTYMAICTSETSTPPADLEKNCAQFTNALHIE